MNSFTNLIRRPAVAWAVTILVVLAAIGYTIHDAHHYSHVAQQNAKNFAVALRNQAVHNTNEALLASCRTGNDTRIVIRKVVRSAEIPPIKRAYREGRITHADYVQDLQFAHNLINQIKLRHCTLVGLGLHANGGK